MKGAHTLTEQAQPESRPRRALKLPVVRIAAAFVWLTTIVTIAQLAVRHLPASETMPVVALSLAVVVSVIYLAYSAFVRIIERRPLSEFATSGAVAELASGGLIGALLLTVTIGILWGFGYYTITGVNDWTAAVPAFARAAVAGMYEEVLFRGVLFRVVEERLGSWLAIGIHFAWNFTQGGVFGVAVSGNQASGLLQSVMRGPEYLSGGEFGAEASIVAVAVCTAASALLLWRAQGKSNLLRPSWRR